MKISEIKELIQLVNDSEITEMELQKEEFKLVLRKGGQEAEVQGLPYQIPSGAYRSLETVPVHPIPAVSAPVFPPAFAPSPETVPEAAKGQPVKAPMIGTFYRAPRPDAPPFVRVGDRVEIGQTLCIIEAMKLMNEIEAEFSGIVVDILIGDAEPVEYGETLFIIDTHQ